MFKVIIGVVAGAMAVYVWQNQIQRFLEERTRDARARADSTLEQTQNAADGVIDTAREQVHSTLNLGREAVRPTVADRAR
jgi:hypothetical protein